MMVEDTNRELPLADHFIDGVDQPCIVITPEGQLLQWNDETAEVTGYGDGELTHLRVLDLVPKEERELLEEKIQKVLRDGQFSAYFHYLTKGGRKIPHEFRGTLQELGGRNLILVTGRRTGEMEVSEEIDRQLDERVEQVLDQLSVHLFTHDRDLRYTWMSSPPLGGDHQEYVGKRDEDLFDADEARILQDAKRQVLKSGQPNRVEVSATFHGKRRYFDTYLNPHEDASGNIDGLVGAAVDVTARRQAEAGHLLSKKRYRELFEAARDGIMIHTPGGKILDMNPAGLQMLGYEADQLDELNTSDIYPDTDRARQGARVIEEKKEVDNLEASLRRRDAGEIVCLLSSTTRMNEAGQTEQYFTIFRDITEWKQYQDQFRLLVEEVKDYAIFMLDRDGRIVTWNEGAENIKGYAHEEIIGEHLSTFYPKEARKAGKPEWMLEQAARRGRIEDQGWRVRKDGRKFWARATLTALHDEQGRMRGYAKVTRDLTEDRERQQALEEEIEQRRAAEERLEEAYEQLKETERLKDEFFANVSHELRTPLTLTLSPLETLLKEDATEMSDRHRRLLTTAHNNSSRLLQMVNGLLDFSRLEIGKIDVNRKATDIAELTVSIWNDFQPLLKRSHLEGELDAHVAEPVVSIDRYLYERILFNLLSNAVKFTPEGGRVVVSLERQGDRLKIAVSDTGIGIEEGQLETIFKDFRQIDASAARRFQGTGLGLPLVREFANLLGGSVTADSAPGEGSTFTVEVEAPPTDEVPAPGRTNESRTMAAQYDRPGQTVLMDREKSDLPEVVIAEDNDEMAVYVAELLSDICQVRRAADGEEALELVREIRPEVVIIDIMIPKKDGLAVCRELKSDPATADIPVVMLTALTDREALLEGWEAGADEYLFKPFHPNEIVTRMRTLLANIERRRKAEEKANDLQRELLRISERERRRIGQDLHDGLASHISGISMLAKSLTGGGADVSDDENTLQQIVDLAQDGARQARAMAQGLNPVKLDHEGLAAALKTLTQTEETRFDIEGRFEQIGRLPELSDEEATNLYWIAQEAMNNAAHHAEAEEVVVRFGTMSGEAVLEVADDGKGLPVPIEELDSGMGLETMRYRADLIGAVLSFEERAAGGLCVRCQLSLRA